ncbi:hypothetical protein SRABI04_00785 [Chryseobacterium sp. Bi04]|nr:hypothetical protein SRABI04_00785 [Chryseobacterium sp. Bi04]
MELSSSLRFWPGDVYNGSFISYLFESIKFTKYCAGMSSLLIDDNYKKILKK